MKKPYLLAALVLTTASLNAFAFNTENRTNHEVYVEGIVASYKEIVPANTTSLGWSLDRDIDLCVSWEGYPHENHRWRCCHVSAHGKQIVTGDYKRHAYAAPELNCK